MRKIGDRLSFTPSDLSNFHDSPFASWMDRLAIERPGEVEPDPPDAALLLVRRKGVAHEAAVLERLRAEGHDIVEISGGPAGVAETRAAIAAGRQVIYQAVLQSGAIRGVADFLIRDSERRCYEPLEAKLARRPKPGAVVQLCCYAELLGRLGHGTPEQLAIATGDGETTRLRTADFLAYYRTLEREFVAFMEAWDPSNPPVPDAAAPNREWQGHAEAWLAERDHPSRVANITRLQVARLAAAGIETMTQLAESQARSIAGIEPATYERLRDQAGLQLVSSGRERPEFRLLLPTPEFPRQGLALLPPASEFDVFFDMEGFPWDRERLEYLFGATVLEAGQPRFLDWWAHDRDAERQAFEEFIDWTWRRFRTDPRMHVYHYGHYETTALKRLMGQLGSRENEIDELLRHEVFVDLYDVVRTGLLVGEPAYSIKNLERLFRGKRDGDVGSAIDSIVYYQRWIDSGEPRDWRESETLALIRRYNQDDCESTLELARWLRARQQEQGIEWAGTAREGKEAVPDAPVKPEILARRDLADRLDRQADAGQAGGLIAQLLEFHRREKRPAWWMLFERHAMTEEQLIEDAGCLAALTPTGDLPEARDRGWIHRFRFDPDQETKAREGDSFHLSHDLAVNAEIVELDLDRGEVAIKINRGPGSAGPQQPLPRISLIPAENYFATPIIESIHRTAVRMERQGGLDGAIAEFLERRPPTVDGHSGKPLVRDGETPAEAALRIAPQLDGNTLFIQGPPGTGKTTTSAKMILKLLAQGASVGVSSNSHKAIENLMLRCVRLYDGELPCLKVGGPADSELLQQPGAFTAKANGAAFHVPKVRFVGGTAWLFSRPEMAGKLDYLFVDEAGQVSVANLVGMAPAARNLVLVGDPMQLPQPTQGAHPGDSGASTLEYLLGDRATVPPERGIFLDTSYRLHPALADWISDAFYDGRLDSAGNCANRVVRLPADRPVEPGVPIEAGIVFVPVEHEGNRQASAEEVERIALLIDELTGRERVDVRGNSAGPVTAADILVVAPYNLQVRKLQLRLPQDVRVGTVDKFQGQEAPIVIVSLCSSEGHASSRGLDFLLNPNRLNVALSRAQSLAIVVGHPGLARTRATSVDQMRLVNRLCRLAASSAGGSAGEIGRGGSAG